MCGLFVSTNSKIERRLDRLERILCRRGTEPVRWHQGPNGYWYGHCLLPLRGPTPLSQPIVDSNGVFLFTGELWDLDRGESDTLVLLDRYRAVGFNHLAEAIHGTWAAAVWDSRGDSLRFGTDRFGEQPLHYAVHEAHLYIGSEIKLLVAAGVPLKCIRHAEPQKTYCYRNGLLREFCRPVWKSQNRWRSFDPVRLRRRIAAGVSSQIQAADGRRVAVMLSGGIDSTIVAFEAAQAGVREAWTIAVDETAPDAIAARLIAERLRLDWTLILCEPADPGVGMVIGEVANRSIVEELSLHVRLFQELSRAGVRIVLTGTGADELFVGYSHLLGRVHVTELQQRFVTTHYRYDLRALNKAAMGFCVEPRNPMLYFRVAEYARQLHADVLLGPRREMKWPLRVAYREILDHTIGEPKRIARETMGAKQWFLRRYGDDPLLFRSRFAKILAHTNQTEKWIHRSEQVAAEGIIRKFQFR